MIVAPPSLHSNAWAGTGWVRAAIGRDEAGRPAESYLHISAADATNRQLLSEAHVLAVGGCLHELEIGIVEAEDASFLRVAGLTTASESVVHTASIVPVVVQNDSGGNKE